MTGPADRVAARIAARPGMDRWIGPDDGIVVVQALALAALTWPGRPRWPLPRPLRVLAGSALLAGGAFGVAAGAAHGGLLTPRVEPPGDAELLTDGLYALSRNPIYAGLLAAGAGWAVLRRRPEPVVAWTVLLATLTAKARHEEHRLAVRFGPAYADYRRRTPRFVGLPVRRSIRERT
jgi:protein-S-isoprenylcysteine O-methyltransferase Ste14